MQPGRVDASIAGASVIIRLGTVAAIVLLGLTMSGCSSDPLGTWLMINVNSGQLQGDANLVTIGGTVVVIDAGYYTEAKSSVLPYFRNLGIQKIDHFFVSHPH